MQALTNSGNNNDTVYLTNSPQLDFYVNFVKKGMHYIWAREIGASGSDDSYHAGLDGQEISSCDRISTFGTSWIWSKATMDGADATFNVNSAGVHTVNVWMREDGFAIDKIIVTTNTNYTPSGTGPAESSRDNVPKPIALDEETIELAIPGSFALHQNYSNTFKSK